MFIFQRKSHDDDPPNVRLMKTIKFGGKDLEINRTGRLTDAQRRKIQRSQMVGAAVLWAVALVAGIMGSVGLSRGATEEGVSVLLVALICVAGAFWQQSRTQQALRHNTASAVTGPLKKQMTMVYTGSAMIPVYKITVDDKSFTVDKAVHDSFSEGETYTLYYVAETDRLLSAELPSLAEKEKRLQDLGDETETEAVYAEERHEQQRLRR